MKCKIEKAWSLTSPDGLPYRRFKIRIADNVYYVNEIDYKDSPELLIVMKNHVILKDLVNNNYVVTEESSKDKSIMILTPAPPAGKRNKIVIKPEALERIEEGLRKPKEKREANAKKGEPSNTAEDFSTAENESSPENQNIKQDSNCPIELIPDPNVEIDNILFEIDINDVCNEVLDLLPYNVSGVTVVEAMARGMIKKQPALNLFTIREVMNYMADKILNGAAPSIPESDMKDIQEYFDERGTCKTYIKSIKSEENGELVANPESPVKNLPPPIVDIGVLLGREEEGSPVIQNKEIEVKSMFFQDLLKLAVKEKVDDRTKDKLLTLINEEFSNKSSMELEILNEVRLLKDLLTKKPEEVPSTPKQKFAHSPKNTVDFLRKFSFEDGSGFKELLHDTNLEVFTPDMILEKVTHYPNFISKFHEEKVTDLKPIHAIVQTATVDLIKKFKTEGLNFMKNFGKHPYEVDREYTDYAKRFKKNIRFGSGREYSDLYTSLIEIVSNQKFSNSFHPEQIIFLPDKRKFEIRSNFYTWVPSFINGVNYIFDGIKDHGNIAGDFDYPSSQKQIEIECWKESIPERNLFLSFFDKLTLSTVLHLKAYEKLKASAARNKYFWSICDWDVEADFADGSYRLYLLSDEKEDSENIKRLENPVGGFKHILKFYDPEIS